MSLCWSGSQLGSQRISHRAEARCGCFTAYHPKERLAFGTGRLVSLNSIRTVRREVDSPVDRVIPMSHVMASLIQRCRAPACECAEPSASQAWRRTSPRSTVRSRAESLPLQLSRARQFSAAWSCAAEVANRVQVAYPVAVANGMAPRTRHWRHAGTRRRRRKSPLQEAFIQRRGFGRLRRLW